MVFGVMGCEVMGTSVTVVLACKYSIIKEMKLFHYLKSVFEIYGDKQTDAEVLAALNDGARTAVAVAKDFDYRLDYSVGSVKTVDSLLNKIKIVYKDNPAPLAGYGLIFGLYIIAVFERNHEKGYLKRRSKNSESDDFPYLRQKVLIFPCLWCLNRLYDGTATSIWTEYQSCVSRGE
jgi:hypothetical protein